MKPLFSLVLVSADADLMAMIGQMASDYRRAGKTSIPIFIDAACDVPWNDVVHLIDLCRQAGFPQIEFAAPLPGASPTD